ncbi:hypothetical protein [Streptomyces alboflavus]|uniref:hypothetical protein n=1 Tax=Streptomyces alboflavus TaxID=67267 RepID=UPI001331BD2E|nr:hypothetical protein [Streptomyces alboflavus]
MFPLTEIMSEIGLDNLRAPNFFTATVNAVTGFLGDLRGLRDLLASVEEQFPEIADQVIRVTDAAALFAETSSSTSPAIWSRTPTRSPSARWRTPSTRSPKRSPRCASPCPPPWTPAYGSCSPASPSRPRPGTAPSARRSP